MQSHTKIARISISNQLRLTNHWHTWPASNKSDQLTTLQMLPCLRANQLMILDHKQNYTHGGTSLIVERGKQPLILGERDRDMGN